MALLLIQAEDDMFLHSISRDFQVCTGISLSLTSPRERFPFVVFTVEFHVSLFHKSSTMALNMHNLVKGQA